MIKKIKAFIDIEIFLDRLIKILNVFYVYVIHVLRLFNKAIKKELIIKEQSDRVSF